MATARWKVIAASLRDDIAQGTFKVGTTMPTEEQLAARWKVSRMTVHRALQELQHEGLVVRRQGSGTVVAAVQAKIAGPVALLFPNWLNLLEIELLRGISAGLGEGQQIFFCDTRGEAKTEAHYLRRMRKQAAGIICVPSCAPQNTPLLQEIVASGFPLVCVDRVPQNVRADAILTDNFGVSAQSLKMLVARGHHRFAHFTHDLPEVSSITEREVAFLEVAHEAGQHNAADAVYRVPRTIDDFASLTQFVQNALAELMQQPEPPTLLFCINDWVLPALLEACAALNISVPQDVEILSFNDAPLLLPSLRQRLHLIAQKPHVIGQLAAAQLVQRLQGDKTAPRIMRVPAEITLSDNLYMGVVSTTKPRKSKTKVR